MRQKKFILFFILFSMLMIACNTAQQEKTPSPVALIPKPVSVANGDGKFVITGTTKIIVATDLGEVHKIAAYFTGMLKPATGLDLSISSANETNTGNIYLSLSADSTLGAEGYELSVTKENVKLSAYKPAGLFHGIQTIRQLLPAAIEMTTVQNTGWEIPAITIRDYPLYAYRGSMLDVARHFFSVDDVKRYIDFLAFYKMNTLHLHLADDQGWRIEIKSWPNLTITGGSTQVGGGNGGFYTQEQYKDLVSYAMDKYITIIPEIDMPGHTNAALASYAELNCNDSATKLYSGIDVGFSTLCTKKEITYKFIDDVVRELAAITPGPYIHIGGDESHATKIEDYIPFENKVQPIVTAHGKKVIGWDEIANATLQPNTVAQYWADSANSVNAVKQGAKIIMSPANKAYLDMQYDSTSKFGLHWAAYIEVDKGYNWDPATLVPGITKENILGVEAPLWSETISKIDDIEYLVFPRLPGYAEIGWSPAAGKSWEEYKTRLGNQASRFKAMNIDYYASKLVPWNE